MLADNVRHAPATGLLTSGFTMSGTGGSVPDPSSCLAIGDNRPGKPLPRSRGTAGQRGLMPHMARRRTIRSGGEGEVEAGEVA